MLLAVGLVLLSGYLFGYYTSVRRPPLDAAFGMVERSATRSWSDWLFPFTGSGLWGSGWPGFFGPNSLRAILVFLWSVLSAGVLGIRTVWLNAVWVGQAVAANALMFRQVSGTGAAGAAVGVLMPHGIFEYAAFVLCWALSIRAGLAWIVPLRGLTRRESVGRLFRDFRLALSLVVPLLLCAALLETYLNPFLRDRYLFGIGESPKMVAERRIGRAMSVNSAVWAPDGKRLALADMSSRTIWQTQTDRPDMRSLVAQVSEGYELDSPTWAPGSDRMAAIRRRLPGSHGPSELVVIDLVSHRLAPIPGGPAGSYWSASWSPKGGWIALVVTDANKRRPGNLWLVNPAAARWKQVTHFGGGDSVSLGGGVTWRPDGQVIAFARRSSGEKSGAKRSNTHADIWTVLPDGTRLQQVTHGRNCSGLAWSGDGKWIAFVSFDRSGDDPFAETKPSWICLVRPDGRQVVDDLARAESVGPLSWSPDGRWLAYQRLGTCIIGRPQVPLLR